MKTVFLLARGYVLAHLLHVNAGLCTGFKESDAVIFCQLSTTDTDLITLGQDMGNNHFLLLISSECETGISKTCMTHSVLPQTTTPSNILKSRKKVLTSIVSSSQ